MKLEEFIQKAAKTPYFPSWRFKIPGDLYSHSSVIRDYDGAVKELTHLNNAWQAYGLSTDFEEGSHTLEKIWDDNTYKFRDFIIVRITMNNDKIRSFQPDYPLD